MTAQKGRDLLLKINDNNTYVTVAGLRSHSLAFNANTVDITHQESAGAWRELLAGAGIRTANIRGTGIFKDAASDALVKECFFNSNAPDMQVIIPDFAIISGPFIVSALEYGGQHDGEVTFEIALESAGLLTFTAL